MLSNWAYVYLVIGSELATAQTVIENQSPSLRFEPVGPVADLLVQKCDDVLRLAGTHQELGSIPANVTVLKSKVHAARKKGVLSLDFLPTKEVLNDLQRIRNDFHIVLSERYFYYLRTDLAKFYGQPEAFGEKVARRFPLARDDIERAGNCLALGECTAAVLHLNRAMEIAVRHLAKKLNMTVVAKDNWGSILGNMADAIKVLPDRSEPQKRKKELWAECRTNLYHVKMAWRDNTMHGKVSYDEKQAMDVYRRFKDFMQQLATL